MGFLLEQPLKSTKPKIPRKIIKYRIRTPLGFTDSVMEKHFAFLDSIILMQVFALAKTCVSLVESKSPLAPLRVHTLRFWQDYRIF